MEEPVCLVGNGADGELEVNPAALEILRGVAQPVVVVAIVGLYRTGKSYLMNSLAGKKKGFSLGSTVQSHTKGIWMWCLPHPRGAPHTLVLLDTEGLGDVEKGDTKNDVWIFALAVLLSSTLAYNSKGTIDHFVSELTEHIKVKAQGGDDLEEDTEFVRFFPSFVWAVRDFTLELRIEGQLVREDEYLEHALALKKGNNKKVMDYNLPRQCIRNFFPTRKCFVFVQPASRQEMGQLDSLPTSALDPQFLDQTRRFCDYVFQCSHVKTVKGGILVNGQRFSSLVQSYVGTIRSGQVPCLDNAVTAMAAIENEAALGGRWCEADALRLFMQRSFKDEEQGFQMQLVAGITERYANLLAENEAVSEQTCRALLEELSAAMQQKLSAGRYSQPGGYQAYDRDQNRVVEDYRAKANKGVKEAIKESYGRLLGQNEAVSKDSCRTLLETLSAAMQRQLSDGVYSQPRGYELYWSDRSQVVEDFHKAPSKGVKVSLWSQPRQRGVSEASVFPLAVISRRERVGIGHLSAHRRFRAACYAISSSPAEEVLEQFLASKRIEAETVLNVDKNLTEAEKDLATQRQEGERLEQQRKAAEEQRLQTEPLVKDQERSHQENVKQLEAKVAEELAGARQEVERALESKLKEQEAMLQQGFKEMAQMLAEEITDLRKEITHSKEQELLDTVKVYAKVLMAAYDALAHDDEDAPYPPSPRQAGENRPAGDFGN
ncbi:Interferon-induced guanylate-binding protein 1 [Chelonia mydas]|uniref:Interferon-induced guanylate-binding protein 1 n=1 Tax=Chelonia mydas TaxID=8469 RepID=M7AML5_CHEMY|nr:Interferon-induced guanylate-binding protein 1 [Chelonia mydas]